MITEILESEYSKPSNSGPGWYILIKYQHGYGEAAKDAAMEEAAKHGYDPEGRATVGCPSAYGVRTSVVAFWFYEKKEN
jgi:hypothetical protein